MVQLTLRVPDELHAALKQAADVMHLSVNQFATNALTAAVDPDNADDEVVRLRERLARAGLLAELEPPAGLRRPARAEFEAARKAAGRGKPLSEIVSEARGPR